MNQLGNPIYCNKQQKNKASTAAQMLHSYPLFRSPAFLPLNLATTVRATRCLSRATALFWCATATKYVLAEQGKEPTRLSRTKEMKSGRWFFPSSSRPSWGRNSSRYFLMSQSRLANKNPFFWSIVKWTSANFVFSCWYVQPSLPGIKEKNRGTIKQLSCSEFKTFHSSEICVLKSETTRNAIFNVKRD